LSYTLVFRNKQPSVVYPNTWRPPCSKIENNPDDAIEKIEPMFAPRRSTTARTHQSHIAQLAVNPNPPHH
jgi:hypothetical protein